MQVFTYILSGILCLLAVWAFVYPTTSCFSKPWFWCVWLIGPPIWFIVEYLLAYHGHLGEIAKQNLEHHKHLQSLFTGLWVAIAAALYWRIIEKGTFRS
jgi:hypothetical protein